MEGKALSPREVQIVDLATQGHTNDGIAAKLGLSVSTVNTYWVRIRTKTAAESRTAVVAQLIARKAEAALRASETQKEELRAEMAQRHHAIFELNSALSLLQLAMDQLRSAVWSTDGDLRVTSIANGEIPAFHAKMNWAVGNTIHDVFKDQPGSKEAVECHMGALKGDECTAKLAVNGEILQIAVRPLREEDESVIGCIGVMTAVPSD